MKSRLIPLVLACACVSLARADFTPIPLDPTSFNQDPVIEKTAPPTINDAVTVTLDQGTNKAGSAWYETGYITTNSTGFPLHNSLVVHQNTNTLNTYTFQMPPDYHTNNCIFIGHNNSAYSPIMGPATMTLKTPAPYQQISVLHSTGNGPNTIGYTIHYSDGSTQTGTFISFDWFNNPATGVDLLGVTRIYVAAGRVDIGAGGLNNVNNAAGAALWANDIALANTTANVTSIDFQWLFGNVSNNTPWSNGRTAVFGLAGATDTSGSPNFSPVAVGGFNQDIIVEADGPHTWSTGPESITGVLTNNNAYCSFTMDGGTNKYNYTWFEKGYYAAYPNSGIPAAGSSFNSATKPSIRYTMPSSYATNCAVCLSSNILSAQIKFATPTPAGGALSFLAGSGNGGLTLRVELGFQGGGSETNFITVPDWFNRTAPWSYVTFGQVRPGNRQFANTPDQFLPWFNSVGGIAGLLPQPFARDPRFNVGSLGAGAPDLPLVRLFDCVMPVSNSAGAISTINLVITNALPLPNVNVTFAIFAVSGSPGMPPVITTQPIGVVADSTTGIPFSTNAPAVPNDIRVTKGYQGTNTITLITSNLLSSGVSYQWKRAPRGGGYRDAFKTFDMSTFANVSGPNIGGANDRVLVISNANITDSADYLLVASNQFGSQTSFVATVMVLSTNYSVLVGIANGDTITKYTGDTDSGTGAEYFGSASDQALQKWLSQGNPKSGLNGQPIPNGTVPFVGPAGYIATPVAGASVVNGIRFYNANDTPGRDPRDYSLEGSNDGATWTMIANGQLLGTLMCPTNRNGTGATPLNPMTQALTEVDFANSTFYKSYRVTVTNCMEPVNSALMQLAEIQLIGAFSPVPPVWVRQPLPNPIRVFVGSSPQLTALATGQGALAPTYQWYQFPQTLISGATSSAFTRTNIQFSDSGTAFYCVAQNKFGPITSTSGSFTVVAAPTNSYPMTVLTDKAMSYWRLDEGPDNGGGNNGVLAYDYAGGHDGTYSNAVLGVAGYNPASDPDTAAGFGSLNTADSFVDNINDVDFARPTGTNTVFSIEAWAFGSTPQFTTGVSANPAIVAKGNNGILNVGTGTGTEQYALDYINSTTISGFRFLVRDVTGQGYQAQSSVKASDPITGNAMWHHLVGLCDQAHGSIYLFVDGLLAASNSIPATVGILTQPLPMTIGSRKSSPTSEYDNQWIGTIDDVAVYSSLLTSTQILAHFLAAQRPPLITAPAYLIAGTNWAVANNVPVTFQSSAYGPGTLSYQWYNSDNVNPTTPISGANSSSYTFPTTPAMDGKFFQLVVSSQYGAVTSAVVTLSVHSGAPDFIVDLPASQNIFLGHIIQLHVNPGGTGPFTYVWQRNGVNIANDYRTSGALSNTLTIGYANTNDSGGYQVIVTGSAGTTPSTMDNVSVITNSSAFFGADSSPSSWNLQGTTLPILYSTNALQMTGGLGSTGRSAWLTTKKDITSFDATFTYQVVGGTGGQADGMTFCIQNESATEFTGGTGGSMSYDGLTPSVALEFQIYSGNALGIAFCQNGTRPAAVSIAPNINPGQNANPISTHLIYNGSVLAITFKDTVTGLTFSTNWTVNIPTVLGANTAWIGFTAADGGVTSTQIASWPAGGAVVNATPIGMTAQKVGNNIVFSWPAKNGGYLETSPTIGPTAVWTYSTAPWQLIGDLTTGTQQVTVPIGSGSTYVRLQQLAP